MKLRYAAVGKSILTCLIFAILLITTSAQAGWNGWVNYPEGSSEAMMEYFMASCLQSPITAPQHLCIDDGDFIMYFSGTQAPCPAGQELIPGSSSCATPPSKDPDTGDPGCDGTPNPVDIPSGNKFLERVDYVGLGTFPIRFGFYFNSQSKVDPQNFNSNWTHDYSSSIATSVNAIQPPWDVLSDKWVLVKRNNGSAYTFIREATNSYYKARNGSTLLQLVELSGINNEYWKLTQPGSFSEYYNQSGQLVRIVDASSGNEQTLSYNANDVTITHTNGDSITLHYAQPATTVVYNNFQSTNFSAPPASITTPSGEFAYNYSLTNSRLESVSYTEPGANAGAIQIRQYLYEDPNHPQFYTKELDARGRTTSSVTYYTDGRVASSQKGLSGELHSFEYPSDDKTIVTNSFNLKTTFTYQMVPPHKLLEIKGAQTITCQATNNQRAYDTKGRQIAAYNTKDSYRGTGYSYDSNNRVSAIYEGGRWNGSSFTYSNAEARYIALDYYSDGKIKIKTQYYRDGGSSTSNWVELKKDEYTYWPDNRLKSVVTNDLSTLVTPFGNTNGRTATTTYAYTYHSGTNIPVEKLLETMTIDGPLPGNADLTTLTYDLQERLISRTNPTGHTTEFSNFNSQGLPQTIEDSNGVVTQITYHPLGWVESTKVVDPLGNPNLDSETTYTWYPNGTLEQVTYADGSYLHYEYNDARHIVEVKNNLGETISYTPNALGDWTREETLDASDTLKRLQRRTFDDLGRLREVLGNNSQYTRHMYDVKGNLYTTQQTSPTITTTHYYDTLNRLASVLQPVKTEVDGQPTTINVNTYYTYNSQDKLTSVTDPKGNTTTYIYDGFGEKITQISPDTGTTYYWYDEQGNMTFKQDARGVTTQYHYDALSRLTWIQHPNSSEDVHYYYDEVSVDNPYAIGKLTRITDQSGSTTYRYDHRGNVTHDIRVIGTHTFTTEYGYNLANNLVSITYPGGRIVTYSRNDQLGRVNSVTTRKTPSDPLQTLLSSANYLPFGPITSFQYGNGLTRQVPYDLDYRIDQITVAGSTSVLDLNYGYDNFNNITSIANGVNSLHSETFSYDYLHRLQHAYGHYGASTDHIAYEYDVVGNRTKRSLSLSGTTHSTESYDYDPLSNQLNSVTLTTGGNQSVRTLIYTEAGNLQNETGFDGTPKTYEYNDNNRLISLTENSLPTGEYLHNALGQRVSKTANSSIQYLYGLAGELLAEADSSGNITRQYIYLNGQMIAVIDVTE